MHRFDAKLYRTFLRGIRAVVRQDSAKYANLQRSFRTQWRHELSRAGAGERPGDTVELLNARMTSSLTLLKGSRRLTTNLSSLSYHHHPYHLPGTSNSSRLYSHAPKPIGWDPQDPQKAARLYQKRQKDRHERGEGKLGNLAEHGLRGLRNRAERKLGIALGRWELER